MGKGRVGGRQLAAYSTTSRVVPVLSPTATRRAYTPGARLVIGSCTVASVPLRVGVGNTIGG